MLLREMQIQNPTAVMIARTAVAQDDITGCARCCLTCHAARPGAQGTRDEGVHAEA